MEAASRMTPGIGFILNTLGVAQYRVGQFESAAQTLTRSSELNTKSSGQPDPSDLAFLAMAQQKLGQRDAARATLTRLRERMQMPLFKDNPEAQSFLREAVSLIDP